MGVRGFLGISGWLLFVGSQLLAAQLETQLLDYNPDDSSDDDDGPVVMIDGGVHSLSQEFLDRRLWELTCLAKKAEGYEKRLCEAEDLLRLGANPRKCINEWTQSTAIEHAFVQRDFAMLALLLDPRYGNTVNMEVNGRTLLCRAREDRDTEMIQFLVAHGALSLVYQLPSKPLTFSQRFSHSRFMNMVQALKRFSFFNACTH